MHWRTISYIVLYASFLLVDIGLRGDALSQGVCENSTTIVCCVGYYWINITNTCEECMPGYIGLNCTTRCPYPSYGNRCQGHCNCSNYTCDVSTGCTSHTTDINGNVSSFLPILSFETARTENYTTTMNVTQSTEIPISEQLPTRSDILRILILVFGLVDLSLICAYAAVSKSNRCMLNVHVEIENSRYFPGNNSTYENIDITFTN